LELQVTTGDGAPRILILNGHPRPGAFADALAEAYRAGASGAGAAVETLALRDLDFDRDVTHRRVGDQPLEPSLAEAQAAIARADHLVLVYPTWWGTMPSLMKAFLDRVLVPGFAFEETEETLSGFRGLLGGRTARLITTMDTPGPVYRLVYGAPGHRALARATLGFCGIGPTRVSAFGPMRHSTAARRRDWLERVRAEGRALAGVRPSLAHRVAGRAVAWLRALRLQFYPMTWAAYTLGVLMAGGLDAARYAAGYAVLFLLEAATVLSNEIVDRPTDRLNRHFGPFTGGARVLIDGSLRVDTAAWAASWAAAAAIAGVVALVASAPAPAGFAAIAAGLTVLALGYTVPPLKLCWRSLGEVDVGLTHGPLVLLFGWTLAGGPLTAPAPWALGGAIGLAVVPAILLAGLPDRQADAAAGKRTLAVALGPRRAAGLAGILALCAALLPLAAGPNAGPAWSALQAVVPALVAHAGLLALLLGRAARQRRLEGRIDGPIAVALGFILWFVAVPLAALA